MFGHVIERHQVWCGEVLPLPLSPTCASGARGCALCLPVRPAPSAGTRRSTAPREPTGRREAMYRRKMRGMYISERALRKHFDPCECPNETYLLCQLQWRGSIKFWQHWLRNDDYNDCHAEQFFLEEIFEPRSYNICDMTWYLSWSPCWECSGVIRDFLEEQPNVNIDIRVARLYYVKYLSNCMGLRQLNNLQGVTIKAMEAKDYDDCWETFIQPGVNYDFSPKKFKSEIQRNRSRLEDILQGLHL